MSGKRLFMRFKKSGIFLNINLGRFILRRVFIKISCLFISGLSRFKVLVIINTDFNVRKLKL